MSTRYPRASTLESFSEFQRCRKAENATNSHENFRLLTAIIFKPCKQWGDIPNITKFILILSTLHLFVSMEGGGGVWALGSCKTAY